jgi:energy-coupling factor transport system permease protein
MNKSFKLFKKGLIYFIPFSIFNIGLNFLFVNRGKIILFYAFKRNFTLEALIYAIISSSKLLIIIYIFFILNIMIDSDKAVSYFSCKMPKSTLMLLISLKLFPTMKNRFGELKEIYSIRGVNFNGKTLKEKVKSYIPILSVLLETSLEGAFDIGEAAYIKGFLSGKRSIYERENLQKKDYILIISSFFYCILYFFEKIRGKVSFDIYTKVDVASFLNLSVGILFVTALSIILIIISTQNS